MERSTPPRRRLKPLYTHVVPLLFGVLGTFTPPIWYNGCMNKDKLDRLIIGKMKNYKLSNDYKEFIGKVGNVYNDDYIERIDPSNKIKPIRVVELQPRLRSVTETPIRNSYPIRHEYLDGTPFK